MLYRIHTENRNKNWICQLISEHFSGFSIYEQIGFWQGKPEKSLCIEIDSARPSDGVKLNRICRAICGYNQQENVLLQQINSTTQLVDSSGLLKIIGD